MLWRSRVVAVAVVVGVGCCEWMVSGGRDTPAARVLIGHPPLSEPGKVNLHILTLAGHAGYCSASAKARSPTLVAGDKMITALDATWQMKNTPNRHIHS